MVMPVLHLLRCESAAEHWLDSEQGEEFDGRVAEFGDEAKVLAGGQSLVPVLALRMARFEHLVDLNRIPALRYVHADNGVTRVGAMTTHASIGASAEIRRRVPLLAEATPHIGHFQIRNRGTIGGSLSHADPGAEYPAVALALDAGIVLTSARGTRTVAAAEFFTGTFTTAAEPDEVLTEVRFTGRPQGCAVLELARRHGDFALAGVVALVSALAWANSTTVETSCAGLAITAAALVVMPVLAYFKRRIARRTGNATLAADAVQSATCAWLAAGTLASLAANAWFHLRWIDSLSALAAIPILIVEGRRTIRGESCGCC